MAKSKLVGEFDLDGSPLSAFNVSKAMAKAREAAFILKPFKDFCREAHHGIVLRHIAA